MALEISDTTTVDAAFEPAGTEPVAADVTELVEEVDARRPVPIRVRPPAPRYQFD